MSFSRVMTDGPVTPETYRNVMGSLPAGVCVITIRSADNRLHGVTATSFTSLSLDPPLVQWSLRREAWSHDQMTTVERFGVSILSAEQEELARRFATPMIDRFEALDIHGEPDGPPFLPGAQAWIDCSTETLLPGGDHTIVVGRVHEAQVFDVRPLLFWRGAFHSV
ncbi:flavin reductase family protein [Sinisalibacter aestuarii]|nr:flavin reductase family protein [Sinisalibacter aestuarii]